MKKIKMSNRSLTPRQERPLAHAVRRCLGVVLLCGITANAWSATVQVRERVYDPLGRLVQERNAQGQVTSYSYDNNGNLLTVTDPRNQTTSNSYDAFNRLTTVTDANNGVTRYEYNASDRLTKVTDPRNLVTQYSYNGLGDLLQLISPDTGTTTYTYDEAGNRKTQRDARNITVSYNYDALNRVTQINYGDQTVTYQYDTGPNAIGRMTQMTDGSGWTQWRYDTQGRLSQKQQATGGSTAATQSLSYGYDAQGHLAQITYPSGKVVQYSYTKNLITGVSVDGQIVLNGASYQPFGPIASWRWGNGSNASRAFDLNGRLASYPLGTSTRVLSYDAASRLTSFTDPANSNANQTFSYDNLSRLIGAMTSTGAESYSYDPDGNRTSRTVGTSTTSYSYPASSNKLASLTGTTSLNYGYDASGNTLTDGAHSYSYNNAGRLTQARAGAASNTYLQNGLGQRVVKLGSYVPTGQARYVYDEAGHLIGDYDLAATAQSETIYLGDMPVAVMQGTSLLYAHTDHLNTPRVLTNSSNTTVWRWDRDPFGASPANENPDGNGVKVSYNLRFPGQYFDKETGLHYNYHRYYDPNTGRYTTADPVNVAEHVQKSSTALRGDLASSQSPLELNLYAFVANNPLRWTDPTGEAIALPAICLATPANAAACAAAIAAAAAAVQNAIQNMCSDDEDDDEQRCRKVKNECIAQCSIFGLPSKYGDGTSFRRCVRSCMERQGCFNF